MTTQPTSPPPTAGTQARRFGGLRNLTMASPGHDKDALTYLGALTLAAIVIHHRVRS